MNMKSFFITAGCAVLSLGWTSSSQAQLSSGDSKPGDSKPGLMGKVPTELMGDWTLQLESGDPAWMSIFEQEGRPLVHMRVYVGPQGPYEVTQVVDDQIKFSLRPLRKSKGSKEFTAQTVTVGINQGKLDGMLVRTPSDGSEGKQIPFTGKRIPPMPTSPPDLSKVCFGQPTALFNGKDMTGWRPYETDKINGWSAEDGMLVNTTPKTDFSATGAHANLRTEAEFEDFWLHIEFLVDEARNSGIYLRGMYEAQVVDRDSRMQGLQGVGAIFGQIAPETNAGNPGGQWQTYDITLVDRHVTVVLNGVKVIDNQPVVGPTAGAIYTDPAAPGPIYLQGDHTAVKYKNIYLAPVMSKR
ncbi:MAG: 3-keto-disaccharide hydrolase [Rubripirellula sp.]